MVPNQYLQAPYNTQFPNPLLAAEANGGPGYFASAPPEALFFPVIDRPTAQDAIVNFGSLNGDNGLGSHPGAAVPQPLNHQWEPDMLDDEASIPDSDDDMPDIRRNMPPIKNMVSERWTLNAADASIFSAFAQNDDVLAYMETPYAAEYWASGLNMVFMHFINVTGPGISIFEGNISCASERGKSRTAAGSWQSLWSCKSNTVTEQGRVRYVADCLYRRHSNTVTPACRAFSCYARVSKPSACQASRQSSDSSVEALPSRYPPCSQKCKVTVKENSASNSCRYSIARIL